MSIEISIEVTEAELEDWRSDALLGFHPARADKRILTLIGEVKRLRAALRQYGQHTERCELVQLDESDCCSCGLEKALRGEDNGQG